MSQSYFKNVKKRSVVFGLVYGPGIVTRVFGEAHYTFEVTFKNGQVVPYTEDGIPGWNPELDFQTIYYKKDIDLFELDVEPIKETLKPKEIIKLRNKKGLMVRCPSGVWQTLEYCPFHIVEKYLENKLFHLFRKK